MPVLFGRNGLSRERDDQRVTRARLQLVVNSLFYTVFINPLAVVLCFLPGLMAPEQFGDIPLVNFWIAMALHLLVSVAAYPIQRAPNIHGDAERLFARLARLQFLVGLNWGITAWLYWEQGNATNNIAVALMMVNILWAVTITRSAEPRLFLLSFTSMAVLLELRLITSTTSAAHVLAGILAVWIIYILAMSVSVRRRVDEMLRMRFINEDLVEQLRVARDEAIRGRRTAEEASRSKTAFLANMSHELRTPLNAILGFSDMIAGQSMGGEVPERYRDYAGDIHNSGAHLLSLINDILDVAKIEAARMEIDPQFIDLAPMLDHVKRLVAPKLEAKQQRLDFVIDPGTPPLYADERAFKQITLNLLSNALKFAPESGHIELACRAAPEGGFLLAVTDNGIGIPADKLPTIFEPFAQADNRYDRQAGGTGLGLALVRGLAELHGGRAWIESHEGEGTRVSVYLPLATLLPASAERSAMPAA